MGDIIRVKNASYARYEELILRRDSVSKTAFQYNQEYIRRFGELILKVFEKKIDCIRKKKTIEYCQMMTNHGKKVDAAALQEYLRQELEEFMIQLAEMTENVAAAENATTISAADILEIRKIYRRLVKLIHPDINPKTAQSKELSELWNRLTAAYRCNSLKEMRETEVLIMKVLEQDGMDETEIFIENIDEKIEALESEIEEIMSTDPYTYGDLLTSEEKCAEKKVQLEEELKTYEEYSEQLEKIIAEQTSDGFSFIWKG